MKAIKYLPYLVMLLLVSACTSPEEHSLDNSLTPFVRFNFLTNNNNEPLEYPEISSANPPLSEFSKNTISTLKIPVTLSSYQLDEKVSVDYVVATEMDLEDIVISPAQLNFSGSKLTDTIYVDFQKRWTEGEEITFALTGTSDQAVEIGFPNNEDPLDVFSVSLENIETTYSLSENRISIEGNAGEEIFFSVLFPNGYFPSEIDDQEIFRITSGFDFEIIRLEERPGVIDYMLRLQEEIAQDDVSFQSLVELRESEHYDPVGNAALQIIKPIETERAIELNTASHFYDLEDPFYRTYGENWLDHDNDAICEWRSFFAFTYPVVVEADNENAVLGDDKGTADPSDDIYYHAFQVGFSSPIANRTTNSFNFARWFDNEASTADVSPGLNVVPALEFYPANGTDQGRGTVLVIPQYITISSRDGKSYTFAISGKGEYQETETGRYQIMLDLQVTNQELYGGTVRSQYYIYNHNDYTDPEPIGGACVETVEL